MPSLRRLCQVLVSHAAPTLTAPAFPLQERVLPAGTVPRPLGARPPRAEPLLPATRWPIQTYPSPICTVLVLGIPTGAAPQLTRCPHASFGRAGRASCAKSVVSTGFGRFQGAERALAEDSVTTRILTRELGDRTGHVLRPTPAGSWWP